MPQRIQEWIQTHSIEGYQHRLITLDNCFRGTKYIQDCIENKQWAKAADYLRIYYLNQEGGIYADADTEISGNFDKFLDNRMFVFKEDSWYLWNGVIGSEPNHPFLKYYLNTVDRNFRTDQQTFDAGMQFFCEAYYIADREGLGMKIYEYSELDNILKHYKLKSWI